MTLSLATHPLTARLAARLGPERLRLAGEMLRFGVVGGVGFVVDSAILLLALHALGLGPYSGRVLSYVVAATTTFALNRAWTFGSRPRSATPLRQWVLFLALNLVGFACNYGTYAALVGWVPLVGRFPVLGVAAGSLAGMTGNFLLSRLFVFGAGAAPPSAPADG